MNLGKSVVYSVAVHALVIAVLLSIIPAPEKKKAGGEFLTDLVSPDELLPRKPRIFPPAPRARSIPPSRPRSAPSPATAEKKRTQPEKRPSFDEINRSAGKSKVTEAVPPSPNVSRRGQEGLPGESRTGNEGSLNQKPDRVGPTLKEKLFDKKVIGDLAQRNVEKDEKNRTFSFDAKEYRFLIYNRRLKERIESIWHYPPDAAAQGIYGDLLIRFTIKKNGQLGAVELLRTSGHKNLDDAAVEALKDGAPFWPLPDEWSMEAYTIEGHFVYSLYGYYIR